MAGNLAIWLGSTGANYNFNFVPLATVLVYCVGFLLPWVLWLAAKALTSGVKYVDLVCLYGYSLSVFLPVTLLCTFNIEILRWALIIYATLSSGFFLF